ncbi:hypothetical protein LB503_007234 [Fusarium chuoi]|nr:hypothetical protein LB503_007234 [Fusarium chuoi]
MVLPPGATEVGSEGGFFLSSNMSCEKLQNPYHRRSISITRSAICLFMSMCLSESPSGTASIHTAPITRDSQSLSMQGALRWPLLLELLFTSTALSLSTPIVTPRQIMKGGDSVFGN